MSLFDRAAMIAALMLCGAGAASGQTLSRAQHDSNQPIEITADNLEVLQQQHVAIFTGNVDAVQGEIRLRADTLKVHYQPREAAAKPPKGRSKTDAAAKDEVAPAINRIDAIGDVFVTSPEETARGDSGVYDVTKRTIVLEGSVVLTRGENVLRGNRAVLDLVSGRSTMARAPGERVRGLFVPNRAPAQ